MNRKKKVLFIDHDEKYTGSSISMIYLMKEFIKNNFEVYSISNRKKELNNRLTSLGVNVICNKVRLMINTHFSNNKKFYSLSGFLSILNAIKRVFYTLGYSFYILKKIKPDYVYINEHVVFHFAFVSKLLKIPSVIHIRSQILKGVFGIRRSLVMRAILKYNEYIFAITELEAKQFSNYLKKNERDKIKVIPEFLDDDNFLNNYNKKELLKKYALSGINNTIILFVGGFSKIKGTLEFIKGICALSKINNNFFVIITGDINEKKYYNNCVDFIKQNNLEKHFKIIDYCSNINELINVSDILVSFNTCSHFSRPVIEAWAQKKAVLVSDTEHTREYVKDNFNGLLFKSNNEFTEKVNILTDNEKLSELLGLNGYNDALKTYQIKDNFKIIQEMIKYKK